MLLTTYVSNDPVIMACREAVEHGDRAALVALLERTKTPEARSMIMATLTDMQRMHDEISKDVARWSAEKRREDDDPRNWERGCNA